MSKNLNERVQVIREEVFVGVQFPVCISGSDHYKTI